MLRIPAFGLALFAIAPAPQELKSDVLDKLKSATVYVVVDEPGLRGTGSGFLFLKRGTTGYIMTCEHVVGAAARVKVIFWSGTPQEMSLTARVVATDPSRDIACLIVRNADKLPSVLDLGKKTEVRETETVFAAGFPFGGLLALGEKNPEISVSKSSVASVRRNAAGAMVAVQISGEVNPGNSGGPLVTADGRVIGVTAMKLMGTQTAFAVPSEEIQGFLKGRVKSSTFRKVGGSATSGRYEVTLDLVDPLKTLKGAGIAWIGEKKLKGDPAAEKDGSWNKIHPSMESMEFDIDEDRAQETIEFKQLGKDPDYAIVFQCFYIQADGRTVWTEPATQPIDSGTGTETADGPRGGKTPSEATKDEPADAPEPPAPEPPAGPVVALSLPETATFAAEVKTPSVWGGMILAPDGSALYALDLSEGRVCKLDPETLKVAARVDVHESAVAMALSPDGKTLVVGGRGPSVPVYDTRQKPGLTGKLQVIATSSFTTSSTMDLKGGVVELVATDRGIVAATYQAQWDGLAIIDVARRTEESVRLVYGGASIRLARDQRRVYLGDNGLSPADYRCLSLRKERGQYPCYDSIYHGDHPLGGPFELSPDARFLIGSAGSVLRLARTRDADLRFFKKIEPFHCATTDAGSSTFFAASADGFLRSYALEGFELQKALKVGSRIERMALDPKRRRLFVIHSEFPDASRFVDRNQVRVGRIGSILLGAP